MANSKETEDESAEKHSIADPDMHARSVRKVEACFRRIMYASTASLRKCTYNSEFWPPMAATISLFRQTGTFAHCLGSLIPRTYPKSACRRTRCYFIFYKSTDRILKSHHARSALQEAFLKGKAEAHELVHCEVTHANPHKIHGEE
jgi:hypothetical protein